MSDSSALDSRNRILRWAGTILALVLLVYLLSQQGWEEFFRAVGSIPLSTFVAVLGLVTLSRLAVVARWASLLISSGVQISLLRILKITFAGMFASNFLPTSVGGDIVRLAGTVTIDEKKRVYASSIVMDRLVGALGMAMLLPVGVATMISGPGLPVLRDWLQALPFAGGATSAAGDGSLTSRIRRWIMLGWDTVKLWLRAPRAIGISLSFTLFHMLLKFTAIWILFRSLGEAIGLLELAGLWSFVYFITLFPVSINGLGVQEVSAGLVYSTLGGVGETSALVVALLVRMAELLASTPGAIALPQFISQPKPSIAPKANAPDTTALEERLP